MYLQFGPRPKKMTSNHSTPHFGLDHHPKLKSQSPPKPLPFLNLNLTNKTKTQSDLAQTHLTSGLSFNYTDRLNNQELADDLMALKQRMRNVGPDLSNSNTADKHTKHKILNRHQTKPDRSNMRSPGKDLAQSSRLQSQPLQSQYFPRHHSPPKPFYPYSQDPPLAFLSRNQTTPPPPPTASTLSVFSHQHRYSSPQRDENGRLKANATFPAKDENRQLRAEIARLKEEGRKHQETSTRLEQESRKLKDIMQGQEEINKRQLLELIDIKKEMRGLQDQNQELEERLGDIQEKLKEAELVLEETVESEKELRELRNKIVVLEIEISEKNSQIKFLTDKILKSKLERSAQHSIDVSKYEQTIDSLQRQIRELKADKLSISNRVNTDLAQNLHLKDQLLLKDSQIQRLNEQISLQKYKQDNFDQQLEMLKLRSSLQIKSLKSEYQARELTISTQVGSLKKLIFALEEKLRIAINDNIRKDQFLKSHIISKTKSQYDRSDVEAFFKLYQAEMPKESLSKVLSKQQKQIKELQQRIEELEILLAARARYSIGVESTESLGK